MAEIQEKLLCYHCGDACLNDCINSDEKLFCCEGCKLVYEILQENNLCTYYQFANNPGTSQKNIFPSNRFSFLDNENIQQKLISFKDRKNTYITFHIPRIHCSSCIWLLENMHRINKGVISSRVDFLKKEVSLVYEEAKTSLREIVEQLANVGYEPSIHLDSTEKHLNKKQDKSRIYRIGVAGFCFGNIMLLSFPEYFSGSKIIEPGLKLFFGYLNLLLALPVFFFSSSEFIVNAWKGIKQKTISIDVPIALGILAMFLRSVFEIISQTGAGYFDSMTGLVFFMLIGRKFQDHTFDAFSFDRDYKSYFPVAVSVIKNGIEKPVPAYEVKVKDRFIIRSNEIIPVDAILLNGKAVVDYSFVTGESETIEKTTGEMIFAGGKQTGGIIELQALKELSQSHLTQLWNSTIEKATESKFQKMVKAISRWFIVVTLLIATTAGLFWLSSDITRAVNAFTAVLVIACPCALALSAPFTFGNILRILGKHKIYFKNNHVIEKLADVDTIVFDKTGTLTTNNASDVNYTGDELDRSEMQMIYSLANQSSHPLSQRLCRAFNKINPLPVKDFSEKTGEGLRGKVNGVEIRLGKISFTGNNPNKQYLLSQTSKIFVSIDGTLKGFFFLKNNYRDGLDSLIRKLKTKNYKLVVLSGDNNSEENNLREMFGTKLELLFNQSPHNKLNYIKILQQQGNKVLMIGDGLNDAGALMQSNAGLSISDDINNFSPASDGIVDATKFTKISSLLSYSRSAIRIIVASFIVSVLYNIVGLSFAVQGTLSPLIAAILMPISTTSLVLFTVIVSSIKGKQLSFYKNKMT